MANFLLGVAMDMALKIINAILTIYMILLFIRIMLTWFQGPSLGRPVEILKSITDPYLNYFRRFKFLQIGRMDFSPILGFMLIGIVQNIVQTIMTYGKITVGVIFAMIIASVWSAMSFFLLIIFLITAVRAVMYLVGANAYGRVAQSLDRMAEPLSDWVRKLLFKGKFMAPNRMMLITSLSFLVVLILGNLLIQVITGYLAGLPF